MEDFRFSTWHRQYFEEKFKETARLKENCLALARKFIAATFAQAGYQSPEVIEAISPWPTLDFPAFELKGENMSQFKWLVTEAGVYRILREPNDIYVLSRNLSRSGSHGVSLDELFRCPKSMYTTTMVLKDAYKPHLAPGYHVVSERELIEIQDSLVDYEIVGIDANAELWAVHVMGRARFEWFMKPGYHLRTADEINDAIETLDDLAREGLSLNTFQINRYSLHLLDGVDAQGRRWVRVDDSESMRECVTVTDGQGAVVIEFNEQELANR